ncbi:hypothetical protein QTP88_021936 [Uroleucon formosanum]
MERTRAAAQPKISGDLMKYAGHLVDASYFYLFRTVNRRRMFRGFVNGPSDVGSAVVFISPFLENLLTSAQEIHIEATYKSRPLVPQTEQLLIIMAMYMDQVNLTRNIIKIEQEYGTRYEKMQSRPALRARRRAYVQIDKKISEATERLAQGRISVREFLLYTGHLAYDTNEPDFVLAKDDDPVFIAIA